jgi:hypothetical protein
MQCSRDGINWYWGDSGVAPLWEGSSDTNQNPNCWFAGISTLNGTGQLPSGGVNTAGENIYPVSYCATTCIEPLGPPAGNIYYSEIGVGTATITVGPIINNSFEIPSLNGGFQYNTGNATWQFIGLSGIQGGGWSAPAPPDGSQTAFLQETGLMLQQVCFPCAGTYCVTFMGAQRPGYPNQSVQVSVDGSAIGSSLTPASSSSYELMTSEPFTVTAGNHILQLAGTSSTDTSAFVDCVNVVSVLSDGGFETPNESGAWQYAPSGSAWTFSGTSGIQSCGPGGPWAADFAPEGVQTAILQGVGSISQSVNLPTGTYQIQFLGALRPGFSGAQPIQVSVDGTAVGSTLTPPSVQFGQLTSAPFTISTAGLHNIQLAGSVNNGNLTSFVDSVQIVPVFLQNTSFETPYESGGFQYNPTGASWTFTTLSGIQGGGWGAPYAQDGCQTAFLQETGSMSQQVTIPTAGYYAISFWGAQRPGCSNQSVQLTVDGTNYGTVTPPSSTNYSLMYTPWFYAAPGTHTIQLSGTTSTDTTAFVDLVQLCCMATAPSVSNASFETPSESGSFQYDPTGASWTFTGLSGIQGGGWGAPTAPDGVQTGLVQETGSMSQQILFPQTGTYYVTFLGAQRPGYAAQPVQVSVDGTNVGGTLTPASSSSFNLLTSATFTISSVGYHTIQLAGTTASGDTTFIDCVNVVKQ